MVTYSDTRTSSHHIGEGLLEVNFGVTQKQEKKGIFRPYFFFGANYWKRNPEKNTIMWDYPDIYNVRELEELILEKTGPRYVEIMKMANSDFYTGEPLNAFSFSKSLIESGDIKSAAKFLRVTEETVLSIIPKNIPGLKSWEQPTTLNRNLRRFIEDMGPSWKNERNSLMREFEFAKGSVYNP